MNVSVLWLFFAVPWVGLQCMIVVFPGRTRLLLVKVTYCKFRNFREDFIFAKIRICEVS